jgi:hypothetical protein
MSFFLGLVVLFLVVPFFPADLLALSDHILVRAILILFVLIFAMDGPLLGIMALLVVGLIFIQRDKYKLARSYTTHESLFKIDTVNPALEAIVAPPTAPIQPTYETPALEIHPFAPGVDSGSNEFASVGESIDTKYVLPTAPVRGSAAVQDELFGAEYAMRKEHMAFDIDDKGYGSA